MESSLDANEIGTDSLTLEENRIEELNQQQILQRLKNDIDSSNSLDAQKNKPADHLELVEMNKSKKTSERFNRCKFKDFYKFIIGNF